MAIEWSPSNLFWDNKCEVFCKLSQAIQSLKNLKRKLEQLSDDSGTDDSDSYKLISSRIQKLNQKFSTSI